MNCCCVNPRFPKIFSRSSRYTESPSAKFQQLVESGGISSLPRKKLNTLNASLKKDNSSLVVEALRSKNYNALCELLKLYSWHKKISDSPRNANILTLSVELADYDAIDVISLEIEKDSQKLEKLERKSWIVPRNIDKLHDEMFVLSSKIFLGLKSIDLDKMPQGLMSTSRLQKAYECAEPLYESLFLIKYFEKKINRETAKKGRKANLQPIYRARQEATARYIDKVMQEDEKQSRSKVVPPEPKDIPVTKIVQRV